MTDIDYKQRIAELEAEVERLNRVTSEITSKDFLYNEFQGMQVRLELRLADMVRDTLNNNKESS